MIPLFQFAVEECSDAVYDSLWAILKYKEIGITRKINSMSEILGIDKAYILEYAEFTEDNRILDKQTRQNIHEVLIKKQYGHTRN